jgi:hypothetical protein
VHSRCHCCCQNESKSKKVRTIDPSALFSRCKSIIIGHSSSQYDLSSGRRRLPGRFFRPTVVVVSEYAAGCHLNCCATCSSVSSEVDRRPLNGHKQHRPTWRVSSGTRHHGHGRSSTKVQPGIQEHLLRRNSMDSHERRTLTTCFQRQLVRSITQRGVPVVKQRGPATTANSTTAAARRQLESVDGQCGGWQGRQVGDWVTCEIATIHRSDFATSNPTPTARW